MTMEIDPAVQEDEIAAWRDRNIHELRRRHDDPEKEILRLRGFATRKIEEVFEARTYLEAARRELEALRGCPTDGAPQYPGHVWSAKYSWCGPFHLVAYQMQPYPGDSGLPDIWVPASKALCGEPYQSTPQLWPLAKDVCVKCAGKAADLAQPVHPTLFPVDAA